MRFYYFGLAGALFSASMITATAQTSFNLSEPLQVLTFHDQGGVCIPQKAVDNDSDLVTYGAGCCASPGRRGCNSVPASSPEYPVCFNFDHALLTDPYGSGTLCSLPSATPDPALPLLGHGLDRSDTTFYVTSDLHFFRRTFELTDQIKHVAVIKHFASTNPVWPAGSGIAASTPVAKPLAVIVDGDITTYGAADNLGAYRMLWERGTVPDSIQYPVLFGLGNHEVVSDETPGNARRMFDYLQARMANTEIDPGSGNYSWDWNGVHYIQLNTWAGDKTSLYVHASDGLAWLANDLQTHVGHTTRPVLLFQHYRFGDVNTASSISPSNDDYWPTDQNAIDSTGAPTGQGYQSWYNIVKNYNIIGLFGGHDHCLGVSSSLLSSLPVTGTTYPSTPGYGLPIDDFDDGSGGDTRGTKGQDPAQESAGVGNPCKATSINGKTIPQTAVASFLIAHVSDHYLEVGAVSWNDQSASPYFDSAEGMPTGTAVCRKRIDSQFLPSPSTLTVEPTASGFRVRSATRTPANVPVALLFGSHSGISNFDFVDNCGDPQDDGSNHLFLLVNGEHGLERDVAYNVKVAAPPTAAPTAVLLTPLSGLSRTSISDLARERTVSVIAFGPPGASFTTAIRSVEDTTDWLTVNPRTSTFSADGTLTLVIQANPARKPTRTGVKSADVELITGGTGVVQTLHVTSRRD